MNRKDLLSDWSTVIFPVVVIIFLLLLAGCQTLPTVRPADLPAFVGNGTSVIMFTKDVCPPCDVQEGILAGLATGFPRIKFGKVYAYDAFIQPTDSNMVDAYNLKWTPTTILQVDGKEACRWTTLHGRDQMWPMLRAFDSGYFVLGPDGIFRVNPVTGDRE